MKKNNTFLLLIRRTLVAFFVFAAIVFINSCKKDVFLNDTSAVLSFSNDTILFDTVFTNIGSATKQLKIYNTYNQKIKISSIAVAGGSSSQFRINVDGIPGPLVKEIEMLPKDSLFIFVEVTVNPQNSNSPLIVEDSLLFSLNGNIQSIPLVAWGQDNYYINAGIVSGNLSLNNDKPWVIYRYLAVDENSTLTIPEGTQLHFYGNARFFVFGTLKVNGSVDKPVIFQGARLEQYYRELPGQWIGLYFYAGSSANEIQNCIIKNAVVGIQADTNVAPLPTIKLHNTEIKNMREIGLLCLGSKIEATNLVISECGKYAMALALGGEYDFKHCTFANYWSRSSRKTPTVFLNNYYEDNTGAIQLRPINKADFTNCIIFGNNEDEIGFDKDDGAAINYSFKYCILKSKDTGLSGNNNHYNQEPGFYSVSDKDFSLKENAFAIDKGDGSIINGLLLNDIKNKSRSIPPDIGAYEY
jgi:hypothetical protein